MACVILKSPDDLAPLWADLIDRLRLIQAEAEAGIAELLDVEQGSHMRTVREEF